MHVRADSRFAVIRRRRFGRAKAKKIAGSALPLFDAFPGSLQAHIADQKVVKEARALLAAIGNLREVLSRARAGAEELERERALLPQPVPDGWEGAPREVLDQLISMTGGSMLHPPDDKVEALWDCLAADARVGGNNSDANAPTSLRALRAAALVAGWERDASGGEPCKDYDADVAAVEFASDAIARWRAWSTSFSSLGVPATASVSPVRAQDTGRVEIYATHLTNDDYVVGASALAASLVATGTTRPLVALVTDGVSEWARQALGRAGYALVNIDLVGDEAFDTRHARSFVSKVWLWALPAHAVIYLDTDTLVLDSLDDLFTSCAGEALCAVPDSQPHMNGEFMAQGGLLVLEPSPQRFTELLALSSGVGRPKRLDEWNWHDQEMLSVYFDGSTDSRPSWKQLPAGFNFCVRYPLRPLYSGLSPATASVLHYATAKPWDPAKRNNVRPSYVALYLDFARAARVPWQACCVAADEARDREDEEKMREMARRR